MQRRARKFSLRIRVLRQRWTDAGWQNKIAKMKRTANSNTWIDRLSPAEFVCRIREVFDFLCRNHGFSEPIVRQTSLTLRLSYQASRVAVEVSVDFRDRAVEVSLVRLLNGKRPDGWQIDASGRQFMTRLYEAAWFRKIPNPKVTVPLDSSAQNTLRLWLEVWAEQLRVYFADVLADSDAFFNELNKKPSRPPDG